MEKYEDYLDANRKLWDTRTEIHLGSRFYDLPGFKEGKNSLCAIELDELGDVSGKHLLHLQCHFGLDTLSWARLGAKVTGVDFSEKAISAARKLALELNLKAEFICADVLKLKRKLNRQYDIVFASYGVLGWLPDLELWAQVVAAHLKPGGVFHLVEFHPSFQQRWGGEEIIYDYFYDARPDEETTEATYTGDAPHAPMKEYWWNHPLSNVINALIHEGLKLESFNEYPFSPYRFGEDMLESGPNQWVLPNLKGKIPYVFSLKVRK